MYAPLDLRLVIASVPSRSFYCAERCFTAETPSARRKKEKGLDDKRALSLSWPFAQTRPDRFPAYRHRHGAHVLFSIVEKEVLYVLAREVFPLHPHFVLDPEPAGGSGSGKHEQDQCGHRLFAERRRSRGLFY